MHVTDHIKCVRMRAWGAWHVGGHVPPGKFSISDHLRPFLVPFWSESDS